MSNVQLASDSVLLLSEEKLLASASPDGVFLILSTDFLLRPFNCVLTELAEQLLS